ncbi:MAG: hypothetical protein ACR2MD_17385 [Aridibacter sp.]
MRNNFGSAAAARKSNHSWENDFVFSTMSKSADQLAIVWNNAVEAVTALPVSGTVSGSYDIDLSRLPLNFNLTEALKARRSSYADLPPISDQTLFLTAVSDFSERTRVLALDGEILALDDYELSEWLITAEREFYTGTDNHPIFETSLEDTACSIMRLSNGQVAMTEVPRATVQELREKIQLLDNQNGETAPKLIIETPLRCTARYFLTALPKGELTLRPEKRAEVTAFLIVGKSGFSYGLWSSSTGLFNEYAFIAPKDIYRQSFQNETEVPPPYAVGQNPDANGIDEDTDYKERLQIYIRNAFEQLFLQLSQDKLDQFQLSSYSQVVWATESDLTEIVEPITGEYAENTGLDFVKIDVPVDEAIASGLLLGSFTFGENSVIGAEILPPVNLARDILALADKEEIERRRMEEILLQRRRNRTVFALLAAPVLMLACLFAIVADIARRQVALTIRERNADARTVELKPALDRRKSYEANLKWYQEFIQQVSKLRREQPVGIGLLYNLNSNYPFNLDPSFYISDMKLLPNGGVEMNGLARNKDAVTSFLRTLEFTGGNESGSKLFSSLTYEVKEGVSQLAVQTNGQNSVPGIANSSLAANDLAPGVIAWSIKGNYLPVIAFLPPDPKKVPPPAGAAPAPPAAVPPPANPNP